MKMIIDVRKLDHNAIRLNFLRRFAGLAALVFMSSPALPAATPLVSASPIHFANDAVSSGWLPFEFFGGTRIFIPALVNGQTTLVMLDSGASSMVLDKRFAKSLGLKAKGNLVGEGGGGSALYGELSGVTVTLGDVSYSANSAVAVDLASVEKQLGHHLPVILGGEVFRDLVVDIDFKGRRIAFRNPAHYHPPRTARLLALTAAGENEAIEATVEGRPARLLFDLGNASALALFPRFWDRASFITNRRVSATMAGGWGGMGVDGLTMIHHTTLGGAAFHDLPARLEGRRTADARSGKLDGNIGMPLLSRFHLVIDFGHQRVLFGSPVNAVGPFAINHTGLTLQPGADGAKVLFVAPNSPAEGAGLLVDDIIVGVDGADGGGLGAAQVRWVSTPVGRSLKLHLATGVTKMLTTAQYF